MQGDPYASPAACSRRPAILRAGIGFAARCCDPVRDALGRLCAENASDLAVVTVGNGAAAAACLGRIVFCAVSKRYGAESAGKQSAA